ncbi:alcohol dehydrogenase catalytic domain-containing protein [Nocardioides bruguierae]|uniref:alcohol dehydrogenase catalytic domain-containing protein n=1 Tax=Nocardioides bruguierae TaxID=2945102 RepID=UPI002021402B|nr:zinc-binding dehydrogenase [Nocardioides bruguierae]MCL8025443.1 zinc-binding dehydrogenase [Nocardioides bruguierae]
MNTTAAVIRTPGADASVELATVSLPAPAADEVLVSVTAATINPVDVAVVSGFWHSIGAITQTEHTGLGWDVAGTVLAVGSSVTELAVGDRVAGLHAGVDHAVGSVADHVLLPASAVALVPETLDLVAAATLPLNALTAAQLLDLLGTPTPGATLLVTGAAGAVGGHALRLAARLGWTVTGLARESDRDYVESAGATFVSALPEVPTFDAVADAAVLAEAAVAAVVDGGRYAGVIPVAVPEGVRGVTTTAVMAAPDGERLASLLALAAEGLLDTRVHATLPLAEADKAVRTVAAGGVRGRVVVLP